MLKNLSIGYRVLIGSALVTLMSIGLILPLVPAKLSALSDRAEVREAALASRGPLRAKSHLSGRGGNSPEKRRLIAIA